MAIQKRAVKAKSAVKRAVKKVAAKAKSAAKPKTKPKTARAAPARETARVSPFAGMTLDQYIATKVRPPWKAVMAEIRMTVKTACPDTSEAVKWGQAVFECNGPFAWMKPFSNHLGFGFWRGAELNDPFGVLEGSGNRMRHIKITDPEKVPIEEIDHLVRQAVQLNKEKGDPSKRG